MAQDPGATPCSLRSLSLEQPASVEVTVIIPTKDRLWSLPKAVESCRSRSIGTEIIVVDDGSTDGTADWLTTQQDLVVLQGHGWGKPAAVNQAQRQARGKYVRFLDSDDWLNQGQNEAQYQAAVRTDADVVLSGVDVYADDVFERRVDYSQTDDFIAQQLGEEDASHYSSFLFRGELVADIPHRTHFPASDFASRDDRCFMLEVALRKPKTAVTETPALCHRHHTRGRLQAQTGLKSAGTHIQQLYVYRQILRLLEENGELTVRRRRAATGVLWPLAHWLAYADLEEATNLVTWIRTLDPEFSPPNGGALGILYRQLGFKFTERLLALRRRALRVLRPVGLAAPMGH